MTNPQKGDWNHAFEELIPDAVKYSEALTLEYAEDFFYISDVETYEVYALFGSHPAWKDFAGKRCYQLLQGREAPCPFCSNERLRTDGMYIWEHTNPLLARRFLLKDRLATWNGRRVRLEVALDITDERRAKSLLRNFAEQENVLIECMRLLAEADDSKEGQERMLHRICDFFGAEQGVICSREACGYHREGTEGFDALLSAMPEMTEKLGRALNSDSQIVVESLEDLWRTNAPLARAFQARGIHSLCLAPVYAREKLTGMIGLANLRQNWIALPILTLLASALAVYIHPTREERERLLFTDPLTGCLNFAGYKKVADRLLDRYPNRRYALWYCDLRRFKYINDVFGFDVGDRLLRYWMDYLAETVGEEAAFCRISGDNVSSLRQYEDESELEEMFLRAARHLAEFPELKERRFEVEIVSGIYRIDSPEKRMTISEMLDRANIAQKSVKQLSGSRFAFYSELMRQQELRDWQLLSSMREAIDKREFVPYFQPQMCLKTGKFAFRAEVLVRWRRADGSLLLPKAFIPLFEREGVIEHLDHYMFECACRALRAFQREGKESVCLSVNVSRVTMMRGGFLREYCRIRDQYELPDNCLELELTENGVVEDVEFFARLVSALKEKGFLCTMDDFGAERSSLNVLQKLPLNILKLDRGFFREESNGQSNHVIVSHVLKMARALNMRIVAEGIEAEEQLEMLRKMGCDYVQGYVFARPMPEEEFVGRYLDSPPISSFSRSSF